MDLLALSELISKAEKETTMGYKLDRFRLDDILAELSEKYQIYAPAWDKQKKNVRFRQVKSAEDIVLDRQSDFSTKEVYYPISQVMMRFETDRIEDEEVYDERGILIFARPCDINGLSRLDKIFYDNGNPDYYYARLREKVKFVLLECRESFDKCFCVSMGTNETEDYSWAVRFDGDDVLVKVKDEEFREFFETSIETPFEPEFVRENKRTLNIPDINQDNFKAISKFEYWNQFDERCIGCGGCNTVCGTCSCFDTSDILEEEGSLTGERRRIWSACMIPTFTETAGGTRFRKSQGENMRFKVYHKFYDFKKRFGEAHMCVGCGRCDIRCPKDISFFDTVNDLNAEIEREAK